MHFEIAGTNPGRLREFFSELFGWTYEMTPVASTVSDPDDYGFIDLMTTDDGVGIRGGVGGGAGRQPRALFYVGVDDVPAALERAERLGATRKMGPETAPNGLVVAHFADPEGNLIGLAGG
ncbi:MAG: VOC family protein [Solirubrobacterales bacterium]|nr:VOC family protein [Solirubrobacterales bacterium]